MNFEHLTEEQLASDKYLDYILAVLELKAGVREDDDKRAAFKGVMQDGVRKRDETLTQYVTRRMRDFTKAASYRITLPDEFKATMLREGAGLSDQGLQNLTALLQGQDHNVDRVAMTIARMDVRTDRVIGFAAGTDESYFDLPDPDDDSEDEEDIGDAPEDVLDDEAVLAELSDLNFSSEQAALVFAVVENRLGCPSASGRGRRTRSSRPSSARTARASRKAATWMANGVDTPRSNSRRSPSVDFVDVVVTGPKTVGTPRTPQAMARS